MYWLIVIIILAIILEMIGRQIKDPSQYERERELNPFDSYYVRKERQRAKGSKITAMVLLALLLMALLSFMFSCSVIPHSPHYEYEYEYVRLWDGTTGHASDIVQYNIGDTVEEIPSGKKFVITGIALPGGKMIHAQTKSGK